ncbi:MAG: ATP-binding protein [Acidobacteria bacterium]|nr:ATP-binding protein [Acidobacteriota bacterium]
MSTERFSVSAEGLRELNAGRPPWTLVKELVQNAWDEAPEATRCDVEIDARPDGTTVIIVEDDGPGFARVSDAWTLMANTPKRADPKKRGRFNLGEKEIIALAREASIETAGTTVRFPAAGGRETTGNSRTRGTRVVLQMPWSVREAEEIRRQLARFRPTDCGLTIDGVEVARRKPLASCQATLRTVIQHRPGLPVTHTRRKTTIDILEPIEENGAWIYEMGIPIQQTQMAYDVDIGQKVPMPPQRDTVSAGYLQDVMTATLNAMHEQMAPEEFADTWVRTAVEDDHVKDDAVGSVKVNRYGEDAVLWSSDTDANMRAAEAGVEVIHPRSMSAKERKAMTTKGGMESAKKKFGRPPETAKPTSTTEVRAAFAKWVREIGRVLSLQTSVEYVDAPDATFIAMCSANDANPTMTVNAHFCPDQWLAQRGPEQLELIIHELAHAISDTPMAHGPTWGDACARAGARVADAIAQGRLVYDATKPTGSSVNKGPRRLIALPETPARPAAAKTAPARAPRTREA